MTLLRKAGSGSVDPLIFNDVVDAEQSGIGQHVTAADIDSQASSSGTVLTADGAGGASFAASPAPSFATPAVALGAAAAAGVASTVIRSDSTIVAFDSTSPTTQAFGDSAVVGTASTAARRDHKHAMPAFATNAVVLGSSAAAGSAATLIHSDDTIAAFDTTVPTTQTFADSAAVGIAAFAARRDHKHAWPTVAASRLSLGVRDWKQLSVFGATVIAESFPRPQINNNGSILNSGRLSFVAIPVLAGDVLSSASFLSGTTALSGQTHWWFALLDTTFNVIRQSADQTNTGTWNANSAKNLTTDRIPVTAGARVASTTVTLTIPTLNKALSALFTAGDSIVVANANVAAYNGTFTIASVSSTQITYVSGGSASDSLVAPFPTVQPAAGKRTYTVAADGYVYAVVMVAGTVPTLINYVGTLGNVSPVLAGTDGSNTGLTGTCPSPSNASTGLNNMIYAGVL